MQPLREYFLLRDNITFLNFGSFGACPRPVFEKYQQLQLELEREPVHFITNTGLKLLEQSRAALGHYLHCDKDDIVYVTNPSYAVNAVAKSLQLVAGDEVLTSDLEYGACDKTWNYYCKKSGAKYIRQSCPLPIESNEHFIEAFCKGINKNTKLIFISHITSSTALRLPVEEICAIAKQKGILCFVDGAHAPGQIPVNLKTLDADIYTGACHKWMMTAKGSSFLYVKKDLQLTIDPLVVSWGYDSWAPSHSQFLDYHQMNGTRDYSAFLTIPTAIDFMQKHNWPVVAANCRKLVQDNAPAFCELLGSSPLAPIHSNFIQQLFAAEIKTNEPEKLHDCFFEQYKIQIPVIRHNDKVYLRYSINAFNCQQDLDNLFSAIKNIKASTNFIES